MSSCEETYLKERSPEVASEKKSTEQTEILHMYKAEIESIRLESIFTTNEHCFC